MPRSPVPQVQATQRFRRALREMPFACVAALLAAAAAAAAGVGTLEPVLWIGLALFAGCHFGLLRRSPRPARLRAALAFAFGLLHGFGFAGVLMELELPATDLTLALLRRLGTIGLAVGATIGLGFDRLLFDVVALIIVIGVAVIGP